MNIEKLPEPNFYLSQLNHSLIFVIIQDTTKSCLFSNNSLK